MKKINAWLDKLAITITGAVGTMWCAILFTLIALMQLPSIIAQSMQASNIAPLVEWFVQTFLQLVLLSIVLKGQNISARQLEKIIARIDENTVKTEAAAERIELLVQMIEQDEQREIKDIEKT